MASFARACGWPLVGGCLRTRPRTPTSGAGLEQSLNDGAKHDRARSETKVLADNLASLMCIAAAQQAELPSASRRCNRAYAAALLQRTLPRLVLLIGDFFATLADALHLLGANTQRFIPGRSRPRPVHHVKPHPSAVYKG